MQGGGRGLQTLPGPPLSQCPTAGAASCPRLSGWLATRAHQTPPPLVQEGKCCAQSAWWKQVALDLCGAEVKLRCLQTALPNRCHPCSGSEGLGGRSLPCCLRLHYGNDSLLLQKVPRGAR